MNCSPRLVLASGSPRRLELLRQIGLNPTVHAADIDETARPREAARPLVARLASEKLAECLRQRAEPAEIILAADTLVVLDGVCLGKPVDQADAVRMLQALRGREHQVMTGVAVSCGDAQHSCVVETQVRMATMHDPAIQAYWQTGEPCGKAGAYAIQGIAGTFIESIIGSYSNVMGLPLFETARLLSEVGLAFPCDSAG